MQLPQRMLELFHRGVLGVVLLLVAGGVFGMPITIASEFLPACPDHPTHSPHSWLSIAAGRAACRRQYASSPGRSLRAAGRRAAPLVVAGQRVAVADVGGEGTSCVQVCGGVGARAPGDGNAALVGQESRGEGVIPTVSRRAGLAAGLTSMSDSIRPARASLPA